MEDKQERPTFEGVAEVAKLLEEILDTENFPVLQKQLARCEAWLGRVSFQYRNAENLLARVKKQYLLPKSKDRTDMDRTVQLESSVRDAQTMVNLLKDQAEALRNRISLGQSLLASQRQEMKSALR